MFRLFESIALHLLLNLLLVRVEQRGVRVIQLALQLARRHALLHGPHRVAPQLLEHLVHLVALERHCELVLGSAACQ